MAKFMTLEGLQYLWEQLKIKLNTKVDKVTGKGLSTNDYTNDEKSKLAGVATGANNYSHPSTHPASMITGLPTSLPANGGDANTVNGHTVNADVPTGAKFTDTVYNHPNSGATIGTYKSVTINAQGHVTGGSNPITLSGYGITDAAAKNHTHGNSDITGLDAGKITTGTISIDRLPKGALERCIVVADDTARFKLTTANVQAGDTVKVTATNKMYFVVDDTKLTTEDGYEVYSAGSATSVPWSGVTGKPSTFTPSSHTHTKLQITDFPASLKNPAALTIQVNGTSVATYDGSAAKTVNVTMAGLNIQEISNSDIDNILNS